jgi:hypothetical protein
MSRFNKTFIEMTGSEYGSGEHTINNETGVDDETAIEQPEAS